MGPERKLLLVGEDRDDTKGVELVRGERADAAHDVLNGEVKELVQDGGVREQPSVDEGERR